jgi:cell division protein ZapD
MIKYEFPLNERIRKFLRIEEIFKRMDALISIKEQYSDYSCFDTYFYIIATASRSDLKVELIQEIEKQRLKFNSKIKTKKNILFYQKLNKIRLHLEQSKIVSGYNFGGNKFLHELRTRSAAPFGIVVTDFPDFQFWLETTSPAERKFYFQNIIKEFLPIRNAVQNLLQLLRINVANKQMETKTGAVQYKLDPLFKNDLVIITLNESSRVFPSISSNKYAVNVHFKSITASAPLKLIKFKLGVASF